jgi:hypothetical protein
MSEHRSQCKLIPHPSIVATSLRVFNTGLRDYWAVHFFPRYMGDPYEDGPIDFRQAEDTEAFTYAPRELQRFVGTLRSAVETS